MPRTVVLKHTLPDGSWHYDWMLARDGGDEGAGAGELITFRVFVSIWAPSAAAWVAVRLSDHRPDYLFFEGELTQGRGRVERVAAGVCRIDVESVYRVAGAVDWGRGMRSFDAVRGERGWRVRQLATDIRGGAGARA